MNVFLIIGGFLMLVFNKQLGNFSRWFQRKVFGLNYDLILFRIPCVIVGVGFIVVGIISILKK